MMSEMDCLKFLIPGLSNLTTDTEAIVEIIVEKLELMCQYVTHCCTQLCEKKVRFICFCRRYRILQSITTLRGENVH